VPDRREVRAIPKKPCHLEQDDRQGVAVMDLVNSSWNPEQGCIVGVKDEYVMLNEPENYKHTNSQLFPVSNSLYLGESRIEFYNERLPPQNNHRIFTAV